jgi:large exoprotein involved in heme utilization and adhesion
MYFLNPYGIIFGENAQLDIQGSFHASASDSIHFQDGKQFNAISPDNPILSVSPIKSFGFFQGNIEVISSQLAPPTGKDLSLHASEIYLKNGAQVGTVSFDDTNAGNLFIHSNLLELSGDYDGFPSSLISSGFDIGDSGNISIDSKHIVLKDGATITTDNWTIGKTGSISITSEHIELHGETVEGFGSAITTATTDGPGGQIQIGTKSLEIYSGGQVANTTLGLGNAGLLQIDANEIILDGVSTVDSESAIFTMSGEFTQLGLDTGAAGQIEVNTRLLTMRNRGQINAGAWGTGTGGQLTINADWIKLDSNASIETSTFSNDGGDLTISTPNYLWMNGGKISTSVGEDAGNGGNIKLDTPFLILDNSKIIA